MTADRPSHSVTLRAALSRGSSVFRKLLEAAPDAMIVADSDGAIVLVNSQAEKLFDWSRDELLGQQIEILIPTQHQEAHVQHRKNYASQPSVRAMGAGRSLRGKRRDGQEFPVDISLSPLEFGGRHFVMAAIRDLTERRRLDAEREIFFNLSLDLLCTISFDGYFQQINPAWEKILGWTLEELRAQPFIAFVHPDDVPSTRAIDAEIMRGHVTVSFENRYRCKDGGYRYLLWTAIASQEPRLILATARDITDQKKSKQVLEDSRRKLAEAQEIAHIGSWEWDIPADRVTWSDELYRIYGYEPGAFEITYSRFLELTVPEERDYVEGLVRRAYETGQFPVYQHRIRRPDGTIRVIHAEGRIEMGDDGKPTRMTGVAQDISERMRAQTELAARADALARSNKELEEFADVASHDLQEPLRTVGSFTQLLAIEFGASADPKVAEYTQFVQDGVRRMQSLIQDLLSYSRVSRQGGNFEPSDLGPALQEALDALKASTKEAGASITHDPMPTLSCDISQLSQVFQNLVGNALKYRGDQPPRIHVGARRNAGEWTFSVADNGIGIEPRHFEKIFVIFQRLHTRERYSGTGIGLAVCKKIVQRHGGRIWVESGGEGKGTTFFFTLPDRPAPI